MRLNSLALIAGAACGFALAGTLFAQTATTNRQPKVDQEGTNIIREGSGKRRTDLNKLELTSFPADAWSKLSSWTNGSAPTATDLAGKVVLIVTWKDWHPVSKRALDFSRRLAESKSSQGLVVIGVHDTEDWDNADKLAAPKDSTFLLAHDSKGEFRKALMSDADPDFYLIDRAGQLRYADIETESVEVGVTALLAEESKTAEGTKGRLVTDAAMRDEEARRSAALARQTQFIAIPELPWIRPDRDKYDIAKWPPLPRDENLDINKEPEPKPISIPDTDWHPKRPEFNGRVVFFYFFHPWMLGSFSNQMHEIDIMARQLGRDVVVVGVITNFDNINGYQVPDKEKTPEYLREQMEKYGKSRNFDHYLVCDPNRTLITAITTETEIPLPFLAFASSDNLVRWWSHPRAPAREASLRRIIENDPGVRIRREAEEAWIKSRQNNPAAPTFTTPAGIIPPSTPAPAGSAPTGG